ncbi:MAG: alpha-amylase family protein [Planctomycetota bacterium]
MLPLKQTSLLVLLLALVAAPAHSAGPSPKWLEPTDELVTPHITWAQPDDQGPLRVLFITYAGGMREVVELCQRFDVKREVVAHYQKSLVWDDPLDYQFGVYPGIDRESFERRLKEKLSRSYDCIVVGDIPWTRLPDWAQDAILKKVAAGTGFVAYVSEGRGEALNKVLEQKLDVDPASVVSAFPFAGLPAFRRHEDLAGFVSSKLIVAGHGKGRLALLRRFKVSPPQILTPELSDSFPDVRWADYDYYLALPGKLIRWAAGREPAARVLEPSAPVLEAERPALRSISFAVQAKAALDVDAEVAVRRFDRGGVVARATKAFSLSAGANEVAFEIDPLPAGEYFADLWLRRAGKTVDFGSLYLKVSSPSTIEKIALEPAGVAGGSAVRGTVTLRAPKGGQILDLEQWDNYGRLVARLTLPVMGGVETQDLSFELSPVEPLSVLQHLRVVLIDAGEFLDDRWTAFAYRDLYPPRDDIRFVIWAGVWENSYLTLPLAKVCADAGFDSSLVGGMSPTRLAAGACLLANLYPIAGAAGRPAKAPGIYVTPRPYGKQYEETPKGYVRVPCLTDPAYLEAEHMLHRECAEFWRDMCAPEFNLGDECHFVPHGENMDMCFSATCIADFQCFLEREYKSIQQLNQEYGSNYSTWNEVEPVPLDQAAKTGKIPLWMDHSRHMAEVWVSQFAIAKKEIGAVLPGAKVGYEGSNDPGHLPKTLAFGAVDYRKLAQSMDLNNIYYYPFQLDAVRDFSAPESHIGGGWYGGYRQMWRAARDGLHHRWWIWNTVLRGANAVWVFKGGGESLSCATIAPDFTFYDFLNADIEEMRVLKSGVGKLLLASQRADDGVAVLYSPSSMLTTAFTEGLPPNWDAPASVPSVFAEADVQYRLIATDELVNGILEKRPFRVLYLPYCQALAPAEVDSILAFAENGGTVLADLRPGVADEHGKPYPESPLDKLFGVRQNTAKPSPIKATVVVEMTEPARLAIAMPETILDGSLALADGKKLASLWRQGNPPDLANIPALIVNSFGKGRGILLNFAFSEYLMSKDDSFVRFVDDDKARSTRVVLQAVLALAGVTPPAELAPHAPGCHVYRFNSGNALFLGVLWDAPAFLPGVAYSELYHPGTAKVTRETLAGLAAQKRRVTLTLSAQSHVYDVVKGEYLGFLSEVPREISPGPVQLLAALPYRVTGLEASVKSSQVAPGASLEFSAALAVEGGAPDSVTHVFRVELADPDARPAPHYARNLRAPGGRCEGTLGLALNDKAGTWTLSVRDVVTGARAEVPFVLNP